MAKLRNSALDRLRRDETAVGVLLRQCRTADIGRLLASAGVDWVNIDMEHGSIDVDTAVQIAVCCQDAGVAPLVRVPEFERHLAAKMLDGGAMGIIFPHVEMEAQARQVVSYCKYPPLGNRSVVGRLVHFGYEPVPLHEATAIMNGQVLVAVMIELPLGLDNADAIAAVEGIDVLTIGPGDLSTRLGCPGEWRDPRFISAIRRVIEACKRHGKFPGFGIGPDEGLSRTFIEWGMRYVQVGSDLSFVIAGAHAAVARIRGNSG